MSDTLKELSAIVKALGPTAGAVLVVFLFLGKTEYMVQSFREEQKEMRTTMERMQDRTTDRIDKRLEAIENAIRSQGIPRVQIPAASTASHFTPR